MKFKFSVVKVYDYENIDYLMYLFVQFGLVILLRNKKGVRLNVGYYFRQSFINGENFVINFNQFLLFYSRQSFLNIFIDFCYSRQSSINILTDYFRQNSLVSDYLDSYFMIVNGQMFEFSLRQSFSVSQYLDIIN